MLMAAETTKSMESIVTQLNAGITSDTLFSTVGQLMPWVITLTIASLGLYFLRKLIKGAAKGKVRF
jgi:hypothetical protein